MDKKDCVQKWEQTKKGKEIEKKVDAIIGNSTYTSSDPSILSNQKYNQFFGIF